MKNQQKQFLNAHEAPLQNCHEQEKSAYLARKKLSFLFDDLLMDVSDLTKMVENKIAADLTTLKDTLTVRGLIQTFPKTTIGVALAGGFLIGKNTIDVSNSNLNHSSIDKSQSDFFINEIKAVGISFLTKYILNLLSDTLDSTTTQKIPRSDPH